MTRTNHAISANTTATAKWPRSSTVCERLQPDYFTCPSKQLTEIVLKLACPHEASVQHPGEPNKGQPNGSSNPGFGSMPKSYGDCDSYMKLGKDALAKAQDLERKAMKMPDGTQRVRRRRGVRETYGRCVPAGSPPPTGAGIGEACESDSDCSTDSHVRGPPWGSACEAGWPGGYCLGACSFCDDSWGGEQLPRRECPTGAVCLPADQFSQQGNGACVQECQTDDDCRADDEWNVYFCRRSFFVDGDWREYTNGYCAPPHCSSRGCTGFVCGC